MSSEAKGMGTYLVKKEITLWEAAFWREQPTGAQ